MMQTDDIILYLEEPQFLLNWDAQSQLMDYAQHTYKIHLACGPLLAIPFPSGFKRQRQIAGGPVFCLQPISNFFQIPQSPLQHIPPLKSHVQGP